MELECLGGKIKGMWKERKISRWSNFRSLLKKKVERFSAQKQETILGGRVQAPNMGQPKQVDLGCTNKYTHKIGIPGAILKLVASNRLQR